MEIIKSNIIPEVIKIKPTVYKDDRGSFVESFRYAYPLIYDRTFVQDNVSFSKGNVLRGLHYQKERSQGKLVTCLSGIIFDVCVDMRKESVTFGKWVVFTLDGNRKEQVWIPEGFAHGFYTLLDAIVMYKTTDYYYPEHERTLIWNDPTIQIEWCFNGVAPILSKKDSEGKLFEELIKEL
jgi:dTDP-4-dehydrorhamnose 3,5-epimerase